MHLLPSARRRSTRPAQPTAVAGLVALVLVVALAAVLGLRSDPLTRSWFGDVRPSDRVATGPAGSDESVGEAAEATEADGVLPDKVTVRDDRYPGVAKLDPLLHQALLDATTEAADDGVMIYVNSGWRSRVYQNQLLREAVSTYGSEAAAARWVATADTSPHVSGHAVDVGNADATTWLATHGASLGLCRIYENEPWHYELRPSAVALGCPRPYADPTADPRMQQ